MLLQKNLIRKGQIFMEIKNKWMRNKINKKNWTIYYTNQIYMMLELKKKNQANTDFLSFFSGG